MRLSEPQEKVLRYLAGAERESSTTGSIARNALGRPMTNHGRPAIGGVHAVLSALEGRGFLVRAGAGIFRNDARWAITDSGREVIS